MKKTTFYPSMWQTIPYSFDMIEQIEKVSVLSSIQEFKKMMQKILKNILN